MVVYHGGGSFLRFGISMNKDYTMNLNKEALAKAIKSAGKPLTNMTGGCFHPDNGRTTRGDCADGDCYCARVARHCATGAITTYITELNKTHVLVPRELDERMIAAMRKHHEGEPYLPHSLYAAIISESDALAAGGK